MDTLPLEPIDPPPATDATTRAEHIHLRGVAMERLRERCEQREIGLETRRTRVRLALELGRLRQEMDEARRQDQAEEEWLRAEVEAMRAAGWTDKELREIGFSPRILLAVRLSRDDAENESGGMESPGLVPNPQKQD